MSSLSELFQAVERGELEVVRQLLKTDSRLVGHRNNLDARRPTPLHVAARFGHAHVVKSLLRLGADPNALDAEHSTALGVAAVFGHVGVVEELLVVQAHTSVRNKYGLTPLAAALAGEQGKWKNYSASPLESWQAIARVLRSKGAEL